MSGAALVLEAIGVRAGSRTLFQPVTRTVPAGSVLTIMGPSGIGKSSLILALCGLLPPELEAFGGYRLGDVELSGLRCERRRLGVLFQDALLLPHLTVWGNLAFAVPRRHAFAERKRRIEAALADADLVGLEARYPDALSGGEAMRVALLRALLAEPRALLLDEPFSRLDQPLRRRIRDLVRVQIERHRLPALLVTHDRADAHAFRGEVVHLTPARSSELEGHTEGGKPGSGSAG